EPLRKRTTLQGIGRYQGDSAFGLTAADDDADMAEPITEVDGAPIPELPQQPPVQSAAPAPGGNGRAQREDGFAEPLPMGGGEPDPFGPEGSFARGWEEVRHEFSVAGMDATPLPPPAPPEDTPEPGPIPGARADQAAAPLSAVPLAAALPVSTAPVVTLSPPPPAAAPAPPAPPPPGPAPRGPGGAVPAGGPPARRDRRDAGAHPAATGEPCSGQAGVSGGRALHAPAAAPSRATARVRGRGGRFGPAAASLRIGAASVGRGGRRAAAGGQRACDSAPAPRPAGGPGSASREAAALDRRGGGGASGPRRELGE